MYGIMKENLVLGLSLGFNHKVKKKSLNLYLLKLIPGIWYYQLAFSKLASDLLNVQT